MHPKIVGAATRYIAGRNAFQTVYWRTFEGQPRFVKVSKTFNMGKNNRLTPPPHMTQENKVVFG